MAIDRSERICVLGAGPAGLTAAVHLRDAGFREVVVLEKEGEVGGKCRSFRRDGKAWELGAVLGTSDYHAVLDLMRRVGMDRAPIPRDHRRPERSFEAEGYFPMSRIFPGWVRMSEAARALGDVARYHALAPRWREAFAPGHDAVPRELAEPIAAWARRWGMEKLAKLWAVPFVAYGYGYYDEIPAAYALKFFDPGIVRSLVFQGKFFRWEEGVQTLWERVASSLDVRIGVKVETVRRGDGIEVAWREGGGGRRERFDRLVLACPLDDALSFLDADEEERALFGAIRHTDYRVRLLEIEGLKVPAGFAPSRFDRSGLGLPLIWDERIPGAGLVTWYVLASPGMTDVEVDRRIEEDVRRLGGEVRGVAARANWKYFPHVGGEDYAAGWYRRFEALQGRRRSYYAGEVASFSTVERSAGYSRDLVRRFFGTTADRPRSPSPS